MTNGLKLKGRIVEKGYNLTTFSEAMGVSRPTLRNKINGVKDFSAKEIEKACAILDIPYEEVASYFFNAGVPKMETN